MEVVVGRVGRAHGLRGEVSVEIRTDEPDLRFRDGAVVVPLPSSHPHLTIESVRPAGHRLVVRFEQIHDRSGADALRGADLVVDVPADERPADPEEYYDRALTGLGVVTVGGRDVGEVTAVLHLPAQDVLSVRCADGVELLVPFVSALVPTVDLDRRRISIDERLLTGLPGPPEP